MPEEFAHRTGCVLVAAGTGSRLGAGVPKAFVALAGEPLLAHAVRNVLASKAVGHLVVVAPHGWLDRAESLVAATAVEASGPAAPQVTVVEGGAERQDSVAAGLAALTDDIDIVLVHDAARCLAPPSLVARVVDAVAAGYAAVVPGLPVTDTIKLVAGVAGGAEQVAETIDRSTLRTAQTPQGFDRATLVAAHSEARSEAALVLAPLVERIGAVRSVESLAPLYTDDAEMAELVTEVVVVPGDPLAFKITSSQDLAYAEWVLSGQSAPPA
jgi:2-C-methyl-D-erythritol 4-phosphate cytidylyltransferase